MDATGLGQSIAWTGTGTSGAALNELLSGLAAQTAYHWRTRVRYFTPLSPFQQAGRWINSHGNGWNETDLRTSAPPCPADLNGDGLVDFSDYLEFLNLYDAPDPRADFNKDGLVDFSDYLEFLNHHDAGC